MVSNKIDDEIEISLYVKHFYKNRRLIFRVLVFAIIFSIIYSIGSFLLHTPVYNYTSQTVIDMTIDKDAENQKPIFLAYLMSQKIFEDSAKSINLAADYTDWRNFIVVENINNANQILFKISASKTEKLAALNRRIVSNAIFQTSNVLTGINVKILEEAEILEDVKETRESINFTGNLFTFVTLGLTIVIAVLMFQVIINRRISSTRDIEMFSNLTVLGTIPDFNDLKVTEEINLKNFLRGLIWKQKK